MSVNRNRNKLATANTSREYDNIITKHYYPLYWDEGIRFYPKYRKGFKNPNKVLYQLQVRAYRTWKYNRNKQWR